MKLTCNKFYSLAWILAFIGMMATAGSYAQRSLLPESQGLSTETSKTLSNIVAESGRFIEQGFYDSAIATCREGVPLCNDSEKGRLKLSVLYNYIGASFQFKGDFDSAIYYFYLAAEKAETVPGSSLQLIRIYNNLSLTFNRTLNNDKALAYLEKAELLAKQNHLTSLIPSVLLNKGRIYKEEEKYKLSEETFLKALEYCHNTEDKDIKKGTGMPVEVMLLMLYTNLAQLYIAQNDFTAAEKYLNDALPLSVNVNPYYQVPVRLGLGRVYFHQKKYKLAEDNILSGLAKSETAGISDGLSEGHFYLSKIYNAKEEYRNAYDHLLQAYNLEEKIRSVERTKDSRLLEVKYRTAQKDKEIAEKRLSVIKKDRLLKSKNFWIAGISLGALILVVLLFNGYKNYRHRQRLQEQKFLAIEQRRHIEILKATADGEEKERNRIAGNLHDGIGSIISAAKMNFSTLHTLESDRAVYDKSMKLLNDAAFELRTTAHNLMPQMLLQEGLAEATRDFCERVSNSELLIVEYQAYGHFVPQEKGFELFVYRMIQELVNNIIKHSEAKKALVQLSMSDDMLAITVEDNGKGIMLETLQNTAGAGLKNMEAKVRMQNGQLTMESTPGKGTQIYIEFDLPKV